VKLELIAQFILPLLCENSWANDKASLEVTSSDELFDEQSGHNRLAGTRVICQEKAQRLAGKHLFIYGGNLVRERIEK
jgi:hypothetical protein